jgi:flagellar motility protein MotE (MotC chaperone)
MILSTYLIPLICTALGSGLTWLFTRKKHDAETGKVQAETDKVQLDLIQMWKNIADDLREEVSLLSRQVEQLTRENISLKEEMKRFEKIINEKIS